MSLPQFSKFCNYYRECFNDTAINPVSSYGVTCSGFESCAYALVDSDGDFRNYATAGSYHATNITHDDWTFNPLSVGYIQNSGYACAAFASLVLTDSASFQDGELSALAVTDFQSDAIDCYAARSCAHSYFSSHKRVEYSVNGGMFAMFNVTAESSELSESLNMGLSGYYAGFAGSWTCPSGAESCSLDCRGNACFGFEFDCSASPSVCSVSCDEDNANTSCPIGWYGNTLGSVDGADSFLMLPDYDFLLELEAIIDINFYYLIPRFVDTVLSRNLRFFSSDFACDVECFDDGQWSDCLEAENTDARMAAAAEPGGGVCCYADQTCKNAPVLIEGDTVLCDAYEACAQSVISANKLFAGGKEGCQLSNVSFSEFVGCGGHLACEEANIRNGRVLVCDGQEACKSAVIFNVLGVFAFGYLSLEGATISTGPDRETLDIFFLGYDSANSVTITCDENVAAKINIYCKNDACINTNDFSSISAECNVELFDSYTAVSLELVRGTVAPTAIPSSPPSSVPSAEPSTEPSGVPTFGPTAPSGAPTTQPSDVPSRQPTRDPVVPPTNVPTGGPVEMETTTGGAVGGEDAANNNNNKNEQKLSDFNDLQTGTEILVGLLVLAPFVILLLHKKTHCFYRAITYKMKHTLDEVDALAVIKCFFNFADFMSDLVFSLSLMVNAHYLRYYAAFFTLFPVIMSNVIALRWIRDSTLLRICERKYVAKYDGIFIVMSAIFGFYAALELCQSKLFFWKVFHLQMKQSSRHKMERWRFFNIVLLEDCPLLVIQFLFILDLGGINFIVFAAMMFSVLSISSSLLVALLCRGKENIFNTTKTTTRTPKKLVQTKYKYNFKFEFRSVHFQSHHEFTNNTFRSIFAQTFDLDEMYIQVFYVYKIRHGLVCFVEFAQDSNNTDLIEKIYLCGRNGPQNYNTSSDATSNTLNLAVPGSGTSPAISTQNGDLKQDICQHFEFGAPTQKKEDTAASTDMAAHAMEIIVSHEKFGLEFNKAEHMSSETPSARDLVSSVERQLGHETPQGTQPPDEKQQPLKYRVVRGMSPSVDYGSVASAPSAASGNVGINFIPGRIELGPVATVSVDVVAVASNAEDDSSDESDDVQQSITHTAGYVSPAEDENGAQAQVQAQAGAAGLVEVEQVNINMNEKANGYLDAVDLEALERDLRDEYEVQQEETGQEGEVNAYALHVEKDEEGDGETKV